MRSFLRKFVDAFREPLPPAPECSEQESASADAGAQQVLDLLTSIFTAWHLVTQRIRQDEDAAFDWRTKHTLATIKGWSTEAETAEWELERALERVAVWEAFIRENKAGIDFALATLEKIGLCPVVALSLSMRLRTPGLSEKIKHRLDSLTRTAEFEEAAALYRQADEQVAAITAPSPSLAKLATV